MKVPKNILLILSSGGMILSIYYACTSFIFACIDQKPVSLFESGMVLFIATLITSIHCRRGWRRIYAVGLHILVLSFAFLRLWHNYYDLESPFWNFNWIQKFFILERTAAHWPVVILILACIWIIWFCGIRLYTRPTDPTTISHRFDAGLGYLLLLLLIKLVIASKGVSIPMEHSATRPLISFIILGLFSMAMVRTNSTFQTGDIQYLKGAGVAMTFTFITLALGGGLLILFLPGLQTVAEAGYNLLGTMKGPIEQCVFFLANVFFNSGFRRQTQEGSAGDYLPIINRSGGELGFFHYLFAGCTIAILLAMAVFILYRLLKWLFPQLKWFFSKTAREKGTKGIGDLLLSYILAVKWILSTLWAKIFQPPDMSSTAKNFYQKLLRWGKLSGLRRSVCETPQEYGIRLGNRFPQIEEEIERIIRMHDEALYGCIFHNSRQLSRAKLALRRIRNPLLWFDRIKALCIHNRF